MKRIFVVLAMLFSSAIYAQEKIKIEDSDYSNSDVAMADAMRADGKIYVVVGVVLVIFLVLIFYLIRLEKKTSKLEQQLDNHQENNRD